VVSGSDLSTQVEATASRLRAVQADLADTESDLRTEHLADEIERSLEQIMPDDRKAFLEQLAARFPSWQGQSSGVSAASGAAARSNADRAELNDPSWLLERLIGLVGQMDDTGRTAIKQRLSEAGLLAGAVGDWPSGPAQRVRQLAFGGQDGPIDPGRVLDLLVVLLEFAQSLEKVVWRTWQQMAPRSQVRRRSPMNKTVGVFIAGDEDASRGDVKSTIEDLRQLTAAITAAVSQAGTLSYQRLGNLFPDAVVGAAKDEGKKAWESWEVAYWRKFKQLASAMDQGTFEAEVTRALAEYVIPLIGRGGR